MRNWWREYFMFNTGERRAIIAIVLGTTIVAAVINVYRYYIVQQNKPAVYTQNVDAFIAAYNAAEGEGQQAQKQAYIANYNNYKDSTGAKPNAPATLFKFDPNTIGIAEWTKLGFSGKQAASIEKYKAKGGKFYRAEDMKKLYVLSDDDYNRIAPYVEIRDKDVASTTVTKQLDLNKADSVSLEALPGIGALLTHRILQHRSKHGNFKNVEELRSIKGMSEENYLKAAPYLMVK